MLTSIQLTFTSFYGEILEHLGKTYWKWLCHDDVIKWKRFPRYWSFVPGIHWSPVNSLLKGQWCRALIFSFICAWINGWVNNREDGDLRQHCTHYDVTVMILVFFPGVSVNPPGAVTKIFWGYWVSTMAADAWAQRLTRPSAAILSSTIHLEWCIIAFHE